MNPYAGGACRAFKMAIASRAICTRVIPVGKSPFSGKSSKVIATFCAAHTLTIRKSETTNEHFMAESLQEEPAIPRVPHPCLAYFAKQGGDFDFLNLCQCLADYCGFSLLHPQRNLHR